jgi:hypothetical protein
MESLTRLCDEGSQWRCFPAGAFRFPVPLGESDRKESSASWPLIFEGGGTLCQMIDPLTPEMERRKRNHNAFAAAMQENGMESFKAARQQLRFVRIAPDGTMIPDCPLTDPECPTEEELRILSYPSGMLIFSPQKLIDERFQGGPVGVVGKIQEIMDRVRVMLPRMLNDLQTETAPGLSWAEIFMDLPDLQKQRQREIYRRLMLDERTKGLTQEERLVLTNEAEKAWQMERRKVFLHELEKSGVLGEEDKEDREKVAKVLPTLLRLVNLGRLDSETFSEVIATEYAQVPLTEPQAISHWRNWLKERIETTKENLKPSKSMNYRIFIPSLVLALLAGALLHSWLGERYRVFAAGNGWVMKTDRWTGQTWKCYGSGNSWIRVQEAR